MKQFIDKDICPIHGEFDWTATFLDEGEAIFGDIVMKNINVAECYQEDGKYIVITHCPICSYKNKITK